MWGGGLIIANPQDLMSERNVPGRLHIQGGATNQRTQPAASFGNARHPALSVWGVRPTPNIDRSKQYTCDVCDRRFSDLSNMKRHKRIHTGEKPYTCVACGRSYRHSNTFKSHVCVPPLQ